MITNVKLERRSAATPSWAPPATPKHKEHHSPEHKDKKVKEKVRLPPSCTMPLLLFAMCSLYVTSQTNTELGT